MGRNKLLVFLVLFSLSFNLLAEPRTVEVTIEKLRPFETGALFVTVSSNQLAGSLGSCTDTYLVDSSIAGADIITSHIMLAYANNKSIQIEIPNDPQNAPNGIGGCTGFGTKIRSVFLQ